MPHVRVAAGDDPGRSLHPTTEKLRAEADQAADCLSVAHVNAESLLGHFDEFHDMFYNSKFHIICVSESWLKPHITSSSVQLPGYTLYRTDRVGLSRGGVAVYVQSSLQTSILVSSGQHGRPEYMLLKVKLFCEYILIGVCYRPPKIGFLCDLEASLVDHLIYYKHVLILGDFNADLLSSRPTADVTIMRSLIHSLNLTLLESGPTHHTGNTHTLLDLILTADPVQVHSHGKTPVPGLSKHDLIYVFYKVRPHKNLPRNISYRDFNNIDYQSLITDAVSMPWKNIDTLPTVDDMVSDFNNMVLSLFDKHAPLRTVYAKRPPAPWITPEIRTLMKDRDVAWRRYRRTGNVDLGESFRFLRNRVKQSIRNSKLRYAHHLFNKTNSTNDLWKNLKRFGIASKNTTDTNLNIPINEINKFFVNCGAPASADAVTRHLSGLKSQQPPGPQVFNFTAVTYSDVKKAILRITTNAVGSDGISVKFIKFIINAVVDPICSIFNRSLVTCIFPSAWKLSIVRPIPKTSSPSSPSDYRPISILPVLSKVFERVVHQQICSYMLASNLFDPFQSGFRAGHSTTTALLKVTDDIRLAMDQRQITVLVLFDFSKAFDAVNYEILLHKLRLLGFSTKSVAWFKSYLYGRLQKTVCSGYSSNIAEVHRGVPQGSVLGPLLFSVFIHDIHTTLHFSKHHLYADDLQIYCHSNVPDLPLSVSRINSDIRSLLAWANDHGLLLNAQKTQPIIIGYPRLMSKIGIQDVPGIIVDEVAVPYCTTVTDLGLLLSSTLSWGDQVNKTCNKVFAAMHIIKVQGWLLPFNMKTLLIKTLIFPLFDYGSIVYNDLTVELACKLQRAQNYCVRYLYNLQRDDRVTAAYNTLGWLKLDEVRRLNILMLTFKVIKTGTPGYLAEMFKFLAEISGKASRAGNHTLAIPRHRTVMYNKSFCVTSCRLWNSLPEELRLEVNTQKLKMGLSRWLLANRVG